MSSLPVWRDPKRWKPKESGTLSPIGKSAENKFYSCNEVIARNPILQYYNLHISVSCVPSWEPNFYTRLSEQLILSPGTTTNSQGRIQNELCYTEIYGEGHALTTTNNRAADGGLEDYQSILPTAWSACGHGNNLLRNYGSGGYRISQRQELPETPRYTF